MKILSVLVLTVALAGCAENFTWQDSSTWRFAMTEEERILYHMKQACLEGANSQDRRVLLMNGVSGAALQTECIPHTKEPLTPQRFEGR